MNCACLDSTYFDNGSSVCQLCDSRCAGCSKTPTSCTSCNGSNRDSTNFCNCKNGFYQKIVDGVPLTDCTYCTSPCANCDVNGCLSCLGNKVLLGTNCQCGGGSSPIPTTNYCDTCKEVPLNIKLASSLDSVIIWFFPGSIITYAGI